MAKKLILIKLICFECKKEFQLPLYAAKKRKFCSMRCVGLNNVKTIPAFSNKNKKFSSEHKRKISESVKRLENNELWLKTKGIEKGKKISEILKKNYSEGKTIIWNKGLTKKTDERVNNMATNKIRTEKIRISLIEQHKSGLRSEAYKKIGRIGRISPMKGKIQSKESNYKRRLARLKQKIPNKQTKIEIKIKEFLQQNDVPFEENKNILNRTLPDFFIEPNLCIYCDGDYWHKIPKVIERDKIINKELKENGYNILRLWEKDILKMDIIEFNSILMKKLQVVGVG